MSGDICESPQEMSVSTSRRAGVVTQLQRKRDSLTEQLNDVNAALKLFDENPTLQQAFDLIAQIGSIRL